MGGGVVKASCTTSVAVASEELEACVQPEQVSTALGDALLSQYWSVPAAQKGIVFLLPLDMLDIFRYQGHREGRATGVIVMT